MAFECCQPDRLSYKRLFLSLLSRHNREFILFDTLHLTEKGFARPMRGCGTLLGVSGLLKKAALESCLNRFTRSLSTNSNLKDILREKIPEQQVPIDVICTWWWMGLKGLQGAPFWGRLEQG